MTLPATESRSLPTNPDDAAKLGADEAAELYRETWDRQRGFPVDPAQIAIQKGIRVFRFPFEPGDHRSGWLNPDTLDQIKINSRNSLETQRNSLAHELGHWYSTKVQGRPLGSCNRDKTRVITTPDDAYADSFALALLMPEDVVRAARLLGYTPTAIALALAVSVESAANRLLYLKIA